MKFYKEKDNMRALKRPKLEGRWQVVEFDILLGVFTPRNILGSATVSLSFLLDN